MPAGWVRDAPLALLAAVTLLSLYLGLRADGEPLFEYGRGALRVFGRELYAWIRLRRKVEVRS